MRSRYQKRTTADEIAEEFKTNAREAFDIGARYMGAARDWFVERAEEMQQRVFDQGFRTRQAEVDEEEDFLARAYRDAGRQARGEAATPADDPVTGGQDTGHGTPRGARGTRGGAPAWDREQGIQRGRRGGHTPEGHGVHAYGYRGMGPRDYQRSDARIAEDINERLYESDAIDARDIAVQVNQGIVLMTGSVPHRWMKHLAEDLAERCRGVNDVENQVRVQPQESTEHGAFATARSTVSPAQTATAGNAEAGSAAAASASATTRAEAGKKPTQVHESGETIGGGSRAATPPPGGTAH
jgi:hypothetical protein